jgi:hypothetical protein
MQYSPEIVAQAYGSSTYGSTDYQQSGSLTGSGSGSNTGGGTSGSNTSSGSTSTGTPASTSKGASLSNTGFDLALIITFAAVIALVALLIRFWKKPKISPK